MKHVAVVIALIASPLSAQEEHQPYAGLQARDITSLSQDDIDELERGGGWGLALPAELNGYPGPAHVLELQEQLALSEAQSASIQAMFDAMKTDAIKAGLNLIAAERALDKGFRAGGVTPENLVDLVGEAERHRAALRVVHLSRHLQTVDILTPQQIEQYNALRGYTADPCDNVPEGHNKAMWRKHNGCSDE